MEAIYLLAGAVIGALATLTVMKRVWRDRNARLRSESAAPAIRRDERKAPAELRRHLKQMTHDEGVSQRLLDDMQRRHPDLSEAEALERVIGQYEAERRTWR